MQGADSCNCPAAPTGQGDTHESGGRAARLPEKMFLRFSTAAASWLCRTTASFTSLRLSMVLMLCLQSLLTSARDRWMSWTSLSAVWSWLRPVRTPSSCDWIAAWGRRGVGEQSRDGHERTFPGGSGCRQEAFQ